MTSQVTTQALAGLTTHIVGPADALTTVVLLHGFGAPGDDLVALARYLDVPRTRFVFPEAPIELGGLYGDARAWWRLDLARLEEELRRGTARDRRDEVPDGLVEARAHLEALLAALAVPAGQLVLGGFSQGAMLALDVALHQATPPAGLVLMSGTLLAQAVWGPRMPTLAGVPVLLSHGRSDGLLPFAIAEALREQLTAAGAAVTWVPFAGGHEIPPPVLTAFAGLLRARMA